MSRCRSCSAPIVWARTSSGRKIPLDAEPNPDGNVTLDDADPLPRATVHNRDQVSLLADEPEWWMPHHATCPNADEWRHR